MPVSKPDSVARDWQRCEAPLHVGDERDTTVAWRELGLLCDTCDAAFSDTRPLKAEVERLREVEQAARTYFKEFDHLIGDWSQHNYPERRAMRDSLNAVARFRDNAS